MLGLITDRSQRNVYRRKELSNKGWANMTSEERAEWMGDPFIVTGANIFPPGPYDPRGAELKYRNEEIVATASYDGSYLYAISIIGEASNYANKVLTLSAEFNALVKIDMFWHEGDYYDYAGGTLLSTGSVTFDTSDFPNVNNRKYLAAYIYVAMEESISAGTEVHFKHVMLEYGSTKHEYAPYTEILATTATMGAYNYSDLNRVERAVEEISDRTGLNLITKTNWTMWDLPTDTDMERYLGNITAIREHFGIEISIPTSMNNLTYEYANNIESVLSIAYESLNE